MKRINLTNPDTGMATSTWFDLDRATVYEETGHRGTAHEWLYHTATGRWVLNRWSQWEGVPQTYTETSEPFALDWLIANGHAEVVEQLNAGAVATRELGAGTTPQRTIRLTDEVWQAAQDRARSEGTDTSGLIRRLLTEYLA